MKLSLNEQISYCTTRIEAVDSAGICSTGTGFFYSFRFEAGSDAFLIITNKHVACDQKRISFRVARKSETGERISANPYVVTLDEEKLKRCLVPHPDPEVDLCAIFINYELRRILDTEGKFHIIALNSNNVPSSSMLKQLDAVVEIKMVGYPNSLWDSVNNMPLVRRGITATWPSLDYNGKKEFVIDCACFPGSSGSPVLVVDDGSYFAKEGIVFGSRIYLLGVLHSGPVMDNEGNLYVDIHQALVPNAVTRTRTMVNLGYVIKSERILELANIVLDKIKQRQI